MIAPVDKFKMRKASKRGFIIIPVLWLLAALSALVSIYAVYLVDTAAGFAAHDEHLQGQALVTAAVELAAYRLTKPPPPSEPRQTQGAFTFRMGHAAVTADYRSEAARIDINAAPKELLAGLFTVLGTPLRDAHYIAERLVAWRKAPGQGEDLEAAVYRSAGLRYVQRGAPFPDVRELSSVLGLSTPLIERALPFLTVYSGQAPVNVLEAAPEVIAALPGVTSEQLTAVLVQRKATPGDAQRVLSLLGQARAFATNEASKGFRVRVQVAFDNGRQLGSEVVIVIFDGGSEPYSVLAWLDQPEAASAVSLTNGS